MSTPKTLDGHRDYLYQIVRLQFFFLWNWKHEHPEETLSSILRNRIDIYRKTSVNNELLNPKEQNYESSEWRRFEALLDDAFRRCEKDEAAFEDAGFAIFKDSIDARMEKDYMDRSGTDGYQCGSLRYEEYTDGKPHKIMKFHIANALQPCSIFDQPRYLPECFMELMRQAEAKYSSDTLATSTWLNSLPRWLELFPPEWNNNLGAPVTDVQWHFGFWGQFITARGTFNYKYGEILRKTGRLPFYPRYSECSFDAMRKHLREKFSLKASHCMKTPSIL